MLTSFDHRILMQYMEWIEIIQIKYLPYYCGLIMDPAAIDKKISKAVAQVSENENYQRKLFTFLCIIWTQIAFNSLINPMVFTNPLFICEGMKATEAKYCENPDLCEYVNDFTGTYHADLYCENRDVRMSLQSVYAMGCIIGLFIMPVVSDTKGKWMAVKLCLLCMLFGDLFVFLGIFVQIYLVIGLGQMMAAFGSISIAAISYSLNSDFFSDDLRQKAIIYYCAAWGLTDMFVLIVYYLFPYWMFFMICLLLVPITVLYFYFSSFFIESPHFLIHKQQFEAAGQIITKLADINNSCPQALTASLQTLKQIENLMKNEKKNEISAKQTMKIVLSTPKYAKAVLCLVFIKMAYYCFYFGVQGCLERTGFNFGVSVFLLGFGQFTGYMTGTKFIPRMARKKVLLVTSILTACIGMLYITKVVQESALLASIILYLSFVLNSYNFSAITLVETQSFSSSIRSTAVGCVLGLAYSIRLVIPFAIGYLNQRGIHPIIASSFLIVGLGVVPTLMVNETLGYTNLQQPLLDGQTELMKVEQKKQCN